MTEIHLYGRVLFSASIHAVTGLHIGGSGGNLEIGGVDNPVIRDPLTNRPYIPGSSLRGKMRSQLEKSLGLPQNQHISRDVKIHVAQNQAEFDKSPVCQVFGVPGQTGIDSPTLLIVRDAQLDEESARILDSVRPGYTEVKTEVAIDRVTSAASPRNIERVPAGAVFKPVEMVFSIYREADIDRFKYLVDGLQLVEDDYLGGAGSRGSGRVRFENITLSVRSSKAYGIQEPLGVFSNVQNLANDLEKVKTQIKQILFK
jgi:CRISPR-associated protein Csm3